MNKIISIHITLADSGGYWVAITKDFAPENGGGQQTFRCYGGDTLGSAILTANEMVRITPARRTDI